MSVASCAHAGGQEKPRQLMPGFLGARAASVQAATRTRALTMSTLPPATTLQPRHR